MSFLWRRFWPSSGYRRLPRRLYRCLYRCRRRSPGSGKDFGRRVVIIVSVVVIIVVVVATIAVVVDRHGFPPAFYILTESHVGFFLCLWPDGRFWPFDRESRDALFGSLDDRWSMIRGDFFSTEGHVRFGFPDP